MRMCSRNRFLVALVSLCLWRANASDVLGKVTIDKSDQKVRGWRRLRLT